MLQFYIATNMDFKFTLLLCFLNVFNCVISRGPSLQDANKISSKKINECQRCRVLAKSFDDWLQKTSRGKYEGGDAAWEETKLKSYSRSEIRLTEIQEGLCSELERYKDQCYTLAEEAEQAIEKWWFHEDPSSDFYTWLCIETLQYCCPKKHYGELCNPCPVDSYNMICGGNGKCDGDGTRKGKGSCICKQGYMGEMCEQCDKNYYNADAGLCYKCHKACNGCSGNGPDYCNECNPGWAVNENGTCVDINECNAPRTCKSDHFCVNIEGSYTCKKCDVKCKTCSGKSDSECTSCNPHYTIYNGFCIDESEKINLIVNTSQRLVLYVTLYGLILAFFSASNFLTILMVFLTIFIYHYEKYCENNIYDVFLNMSFSYVQ